MSDGICSAEVEVGKAPADDGDGSRVDGVALGEVAAVEDGDVKCIEVAGCDGETHDGLEFARSGGPVFDGENELPTGVGIGERCGELNPGNAGEGAEAVQRCCIPRSLFLGGVITLCGESGWSVRIFSGE